MGEYSGAIHDATDGEGYLARAVLDRTTLDSIRESNLAFLALVAARHSGEPPAGAYGLGRAAVRQIALLDAAARDSAARCPYTLFNVRFEDEAFWQAVAREPRRPGAASSGEEATFARTAVFLAWHLVQHSGLTASVVLGMTAGVQAAWRRLPLAALDHAASVALPYLSARWGNHPSYWPRLLKAVPADRARADAVRLLGLQLLAVEGIRLDPPAARPARG
jgi:hypothetical protein